MFPNGNVGLENSKFYEDVPARGHLIGRAATGSCPKSHAYRPDDRAIWSRPVIQHELPTLPQVLRRLPRSR
jgi:hypothetical protein